MGKYLDRLRAQNSTGKSNEVSKVSEPGAATPFDTLDTPVLGEDRKIETYLNHLRGSTSGGERNLPPRPPFKLGELQHAAAWSAWWDAVERIRKHCALTTEGE